MMRSNEREMGDGGVSLESDQGGRPFFVSHPSRGVCLVISGPNGRRWMVYE